MSEVVGVGKSVGKFAMVAILVVGCGSSFSSGPADGSSDAHSGHDGPGSGDASPDVAEDGGAPAESGGPTESGGPDGMSGWSSVCPENRPAVGAACSMPSLQCEYPNTRTIQYDVACSSILLCDPTTNKWSEFATPSKCRSDKPNPPICVSHPTTGACVDTKEFCVYSTEACFCTASLATGTGSWSCAPPAGCPMPRPRVGSACSGMQSCEYIPCAYLQQCVNGAWQGMPVACGG